MIVVDASVAMKWYVPEPGHREALDLITGRDALIAPDLITYEVLNALRQKLKRREITAGQFETAPDLLFRALERLVPSPSLASLAASFSLSLDHPIYDCAYVACALKEDAVLITADTRLMRKITDLGLAHHARLLGADTTHPAS